MKRFVALAIVLIACTSNPTVGEAAEIANIYFAPETTRVVVYANIEEVPQNLVLRAEEGGATCDSVSLVAGTDDIHPIFSGSIGLDALVQVRVPDELTSIKRITLNCRSDNPKRAHLYLEGESVN